MFNLPINSKAVSKIILVIILLVVVAAIAGGVVLTQLRGPTQETPTLTVSVSAIPSSINTLQTSTVTTTVVNGTSPVSGASIGLSSSGGSLGSTTGTTNGTGMFSTTFSSTTSGTFTVTVTASKSGFTGGQISCSIIVTQAPVVAILSDSSYIESGYFHVVGEVQNLGSLNLQYVKITATFYDSANNVIATGFTFTGIDVLVPQQKSPFDVSSYPSQDLVVDHYKVVVSDYSSTTNQPYRSLVAQGVTTSAEFGYYQIKGEVKNTGTRTATYVKLVVTYYNAEGKVIGIAFTFTNPIDIDAGQTAQFDCSSYPLEILPASYQLQVQGS
jgi:hypothetical protein